MAGSGIVNTGHTGFAGWILGDTDDPLGMATPEFGWSGLVPPVPASRGAAPATAKARAAAGGSGPTVGGGGWAIEVPESRGDWRSRDERRRAAALRGWSEILALDPGASALGKQLAGARDEHEAADSL